MRAGLVARLVLCGATLLCVGGCGRAAHKTARQTPTVRATASAEAAPAPDGLRIGVVGPLSIDITGAVSEHGTLEQEAGRALVAVSAQAAGVATVAAAAEEHPASHFALVGGSTRGYRHPNLVGLVLDEQQAAMLGGVVAGLVAGDQGGEEPRVGWVGPQERRLAAAFARGAQGIRPGLTVLRVWSTDLPAACKEAALAAIDRGAVAVIAHGGACADAAIAGAHEQNRVGLRIADFEYPAVAAGVVAADAVAGSYRGGEDVVFGASSGAIGIRRLDPRVSPDIAARARAAAQQLASGLRPSG
jgi:hypothetical protein